nr:SMC-Scp complex subunit ScpB [Actinocrispum wychmicini]
MESPEVEPAGSESAEVEPADAQPAGSDSPGVEPAEAEPDPADQAGEEGTTTSDLPDLSADPALHAALEALLLVIDGPAEEESLADALDQPVKRVREALEALAEHYHVHDRGIDLRNVGGGWRFYTRDRFAPFVEKLLLGGQRAKLTRAALESLAVIAYRQPVTRARVAAVRGVNVDGVIRTLLVRGLIEETGTDRDTGGILYRTTELFLERLGLSSLEDLPPIAPLLPEVDAIDDV